MVIPCKFPEYYVRSTHYESGKSWSARKGIKTIISLFSQSSHVTQFCLHSWMLHLLASVFGQICMHTGMHSNIHVACDDTLATTWSIKAAILL